MIATPATGNDVFVARQPIFDTRLRVFGYELLFRSGMDNYCAGVSPEVATSQVISNGMTIGLASLTDGRPAFVNFSRSALVDDFAFLMAPQEVVVEVLETVEPDDQVLAACERLKKVGYRLALDDFTERPGYGRLVELADFIKVDVLTTPGASRATLPTRYATGNRHLLAEKVETRDVFAETAGQGYRYFQGYFFSRPTIVASKALPGYRLNYLRLLRELNRPDVDLRRLEDIVKQDASMTLRILRRVNSAAYGFRMTTSALSHALVLLGEREIRVCATVWSLAELARGLPPELVVSSTLRARLCELLAEPAGLGDRASDLFLVGMFSMLDAILEQPMEQIVGTLPLADDVRDALVGGQNPLRGVVDCAVAYERGQWDAVGPLARASGIAETDLARCYPEAIAWARGVFEVS
jgi:EAL and modified HD-GYP domain-containing signal transduction protein